MMRKFIKILLCLAFVSLFTATVAAEPSSPAGENPFAASLSSAPIYNQAEGETEAAVYIIQLKDEPLATYTGGVDGLAATSPLATGARKLDSNSQESLAYEQYLADKQDQLVAGMNNLLGRSVDIRFYYRHAYNGVAAFLSPAEAAQVAGMNGVNLLYREGIEEILTDAGPAFIGAETIWNASGGNKGEGIIVGIIDTGINSGHPSFADIGGDGYDHTNPFGAGNYVGYCVSNPSFCNDKLIGAWALHPSSTNPEDADGHGSHTASTVAGNYLDNPILHAPTISYTFASLSGVAPHANIIAYQVCVPTCPTGSTTAAVNQAVIDGVDVTNYSISGGVNPYVETTAVAFRNAVAAGVFPANSAGNSGPGAGTVGHQGPWIMTVAASTHNRAVLNSVVDLNNSTGTHPDILGESAAAGYGPATLIYAGDPPYNNPLCNPFTGTPFTGEIIVCDRGVIGRVEKGQNVLNAGGGGMILANDVNSAASLNADTHVLPATHISYADGVALKAWMAAGTGDVGRITGGTVDYNAMYGDNMASFSSRGPAGGTVPGLANLIKPDVTAPGLNILAAYRAGFSAPPEFNIISGTSMSSPHAAGAAALIRAMHPTWSPAEVKSALMMTGITALDKENNTTPADPFDLGAGRVNLTAAGDVGFVLNITDAEYVAANPAIGGDPKLLNLPSLANNACAGTCTWTRTLRSVLSTDQEYNASVSGPTGVTGTVTPSNFTIPAGGTQVITIELDVTGATIGAWAFAQVNIQPVIVMAPSAGGGTFSSTSTPNAAIPDNAYNGTLGSMICNTIDASSIPAGSVISDVTIAQTAIHTWVGDMTVKLETPNGTVLALMERPQGDGTANNTGDNGADTPFGDESNFSSNFPISYNDTYANNPEQMGLGIGTAANVCGDDGRCQFFPNPDQALVVGNSVANFAALDGENASGNWRLCMGDSAGGDLGTFVSWTLTVDYVGGGGVPAVHMPVAVITQAAPQGAVIDVDPTSLSSTQAPDTVVEQTLTISNLGSDPLTWTIDEAEPARIELTLGEPSPMLGGDPVSLIVDDGTAENGIGIGGTAQFLWLNRFTPAANEYPITLDEVDILFAPFTGVAVGQSIDIYIYEDADGNPANGATHVASLTGQTIQVLGSFHTYPINATLNGPGDVLIMVVMRTILGSPHFPASIDQSTSQVRSWAGFGGTIANPPVLPAQTFGTIDSFGFPGNWLIRGFGTSGGGGGACDSPSDVPWLSVNPDSGTTGPGSSSNVTVTLDSTGLALGEYNAYLCVGSNDAGNPLVSVPVTLTVDEPPLVPVIDVSPASLEATQLADQQTTQTLDIGNTGDADLDWSIYEDGGAGRIGGGDWADDFDSYTTGQNLHGVGGWKGWENNPTYTAFTTDVEARSAPNSVDIAGDADLVHEYSGATSGQWTYTAWQYIPSSMTGLSYFIMLNTYNDVGTKNWSVQVNFDAGANVVTNDGFSGGTLTLIEDQWVELRLEIDLDADTQDFYYNNQLLYSGSWTGEVSGGGALNIGAVDLYANGASSVYYDDMSLVGPPPLPCEFSNDMPWLSVSPTSGTTAPGGSDPVTVTFDSTGLDTGTYTGLLCVSSNDAATPLVEVPVTLTVTEFVPEYGVVVAAVDADLSGAPDTTVMYTVWITNTGNVTDTFDLAATGIWDAMPAETSVTLGAGLGTSVMVHVDIPADADNNETDVTTFTATSQADPTATGSVALTTTAVVVDTTFYIYLPIILKP